MDVKNYYETNGYVVLRNLVPSELIDKLLKLYAEQIVPLNYPFFDRIQMLTSLTDITSLDMSNSHF